MAATLVTNIQLLAGINNPLQPLRGKDLATLNSITNAYLIIEDDTIIDFGEMRELKTKNQELRTIDAQNQIILPSWCDSHTHLVFAASREDEFVDKIINRDLYNPKFTIPLQSEIITKDKWLTINRQ